MKDWEEYGVVRRYRVKEIYCLMTTRMTGVLNTQIILVPVPSGESDVSETTGH